MYRQLILQLPVTVYVRSSCSVQNFVCRS